MSDGGIACAAAEMALASGYGVSIDLDSAFTIYADDHTIGYRAKNALFGEGQGRILLAASVANANTIEELAKAAEIPSTPALSTGNITADRNLTLYDDNSELGILNLPLARLREAHESWLPTYMSKVD